MGVRQETLELTSWLRGHGLAEWAECVDRTLWGATSGEILDELWGELRQLRASETLDEDIAKKVDAIMDEIDRIYREMSSRSSS